MSIFKSDPRLFRLFPSLIFSIAENEEIFSSPLPWIVDWNILLFRKSVKHLDRKKELKKGAVSSSYKVWRSIYVKSCWF
jgi:hypothetical protein